MNNIALKKINFDNQNIFLNINQITITFEATILQCADNKLKIIIPGDIKILRPGQSVVVKIEIFKEE